jgi:lysophospholipase L1-like esterase
MIASDAAVAAAAPLPHRGSLEHSSRGNGTIAAQSGPGKRASVRHAATSAPTDATGALSTVSSVTVHGGYTAAGIGMRNLGYGTISITGVPTGATIQSATLLWDILANQTDPTFAKGTFNGNPVTGTEWASGASPCWPVSSNLSYEADVTSLVNGNGSYKLAGFATGESDGADPWNVGSTPPLLEGASLVVVYTLASMPETTIQIAEGATETQSGNTASATLSGFTASVRPSATTTYIVADGQEAGNTAAFNGTTLPGVSFPGADPQAVPNYSQGNLWDTVTTDVSSLVNPGDRSATLAVTGYNDCLVWVGQVLAVRNAATGTVIGFGDSVAAGYGLSQAAEWNPGFLSSRFPDGNAGCDLTPDAYPCVLAQSLTGTQQGSDNYAVQGASSDQVLSDELPLAGVMTLAQQAAVTTVTLTVGANDIDFSGCLSDEFQFKTDHCLAGNINNLQVSKPTSVHLNHLASNLQQIFAQIHADFPNAAIDVTGYYQPFPPPPSSGSDACPLFAVPALAALQAQQGIGLAAILTYLKNLPQFESEFQTRFYIVASFLQGQLDQVIQGAATTAHVAGLPVSYVDLSSTFSGHDLCQKAQSWVFAPRLIADIAAVLNVDNTFGTPTCPDPAPASEGSEVNKTIFHDSLGFAIFYSNCIPHPIQAGQQAIAHAITSG